MLTNGTGSASDLATECERLATALDASEPRYRTLFDYAQVGILLADAESYYLDANTTACQMLGYTRDELIGLHASDIVEPLEVPHIAAALGEIHSNSDHQKE